MSNVKQVIIIRKDLKMRKGKMIAQGAHASMKVFLDQEVRFPSNSQVSDGDEYFITKINSEIREWIEGSFTKICVGVDSKQELLDVFDEAVLAGIPCSLIEDNGLTEFKGIKTYTAVAIGPALSDDIDKITGGLRLL